MTNSIYMSRLDLTYEYSVPSSRQYYVVEFISPAPELGAMVESFAFEQFVRYKNNKEAILNYISDNKFDLLTEKLKQFKRVNKSALNTLFTKKYGMPYNAKEVLRVLDFCRDYKEADKIVATLRRTGEYHGNIFVLETGKYSPVSPEIKENSVVDAGDDRVSDLINASLTNKSRNEDLFRARMRHLKNEIAKKGGKMKIQDGTIDSDSLEAEITGPGLDDETVASLYDPKEYANMRLETESQYKDKIRGLYEVELAAENYAMLNPDLATELGFPPAEIQKIRDSISALEARRKEI